MTEQCHAVHPGYGVRCERDQEHNRKPTAAERGSHRAEIPMRFSGPIVQPGTTVVSW